MTAGRWYWLRYAISFSRSDKRVQLYVGDNKEGSGSWVLDAKHTEAANEIRTFKFGVMLAPHNFVGHYDDVTFYDGVAD